METVRELISAGALRVEDVAVVRWPPMSRGPEAWHDKALIAHPALSDHFWSLLFGLVFYVPLATLSAGGTPRDESDLLSDLGITDDFIRLVRARIHENTSAIFLLTPDATVDRVVSQFAELDFTIMSANLTNRQEFSLRTTFVA